MELRGQIVLDSMSAQYKDQTGLRDLEIPGNLVLYVPAVELVAIP